MVAKGLHCQTLFFFLGAGHSGGGMKRGAEGNKMLTSVLMGLGLLLLFEGLGPLLMPRAWQQMLRLLSEQPPEQLRRIGGSLVVAGGVILWMLSR